MAEIARLKSELQSLFAGDKGMLDHDCFSGTIAAWPV